MPIAYPDSDPASAVFSGNCAPEEADALLDWLRRTSAPSVDLTDGAVLHTALIQLLLAGRVRLAAMPADPLLVACLSPWLSLAPASGSVAATLPDGTAPAGSLATATATTTNPVTTNSATTKKVPRPARSRRASAPRPDLGVPP